MEQETNYLGGTSFTHKYSTAEVLVMLEEVTEESSVTPVYFVSVHQENKEQRTTRIDSRWYETVEEAMTAFTLRVKTFENSPWWVRESYID